MNTCSFDIALRLAAMALLRYMTFLPRRNAEMPDPAGPLSSSVPSTEIEQANAAVARVRVKTKQGRRILCIVWLTMAVGFFAN